MSRFGHPEQSTRPWISSIKDQNDSSIPPKRSLKDSSSSHPHHDNLPSTRVATIRPARRDQTVKSNVKLSGIPQQMSVVAFDTTLGYSETSFDSTDLRRTNQQPRFRYNRC